MKTSNRPVIIVPPSFNGADYDMVTTYAMGTWPEFILIRTPLHSFQRSGHHRDINDLRECVRRVTSVDVMTPAERVQILVPDPYDFDVIHAAARGAWIRLCHCGLYNLPNTWCRCVPDTEIREHSRSMAGEHVVLSAHECLPVEAQPKRLYDRDAFLESFRSGGTSSLARSVARRQ